MTERTTRKLIGSIDVDAGLVAVGDPCYTTGRDASSAVESWLDYCRRIESAGLHDPHQYVNLYLDKDNDTDDRI